RRGGADQGAARTTPATREAPRPQTGTKPEAPLAPSVRKIAAETGIDVSTVPGSGKDGRVTKGDMMAAIERAASAPTPVAQTAAAGQARAPAPGADAGGRRGAGRAREDDPGAGDHRASPQGGAEHRRHAHDL